MPARTLRPRLDDETIAFRREVYTIAADLDEIGQATPQEIAQTYRAKTGDSSSRTKPARIARLLDDPARYSPFVDDVAVRRALRFDLDAIEGLSDLEWQTVTRRLATMRDPWDVQASRVPLYDVAEGMGLTGARSAAMGDLYPGHNEAERVKTERLRAFQSLPADVRARLTTAVEVARKAGLA